MKHIYLLLCICLSAATSAQSIQITEMTVNSAPGGVSINLKTRSFNGAGFIGHTQTVVGNLIEVKACFSFNMLLPVLDFENDFFIPAPAGIYVVNVEVFNSSTQETCDYFSSGGAATASVLGTPQFINPEGIAIYPNPTSGLLQIKDYSNVQVYDMTGRLAANFNENDRVDLSALANGMYLVSIEKSGTRSVGKVVVRH